MRRVWANPSKEFEQQHSARVHIGRHAKRIAGNLFRRSVVGRQQALRLRHSTTLATLAKQPGDAEIQQLDLALIGHEDVRWLEIAVDDQARVRM
jgi:hypothetical protein